MVFKNNFGFKSSWQRSKALKELTRHGLPTIIAVDFDGCLTNDFVYVNSNGDEFVRATRKDGLGASRLRALGVQVLIVSSETNEVVGSRAKKIGVEVIQGVSNKVQVLKDYVEKQNIFWEEVWFLGNDVNDLEVVSSVKVSLCPLDAALEIRRVASIVLPINGGEGILNFIAQSFEAMSKRSFRCPVV